jgi:dsRNA-specific ribonuclease
MNNPFNTLITKTEIEDILNMYKNIGDDNTRLEINSELFYRKAFTHESYYQSIKNISENDTLYIDFLPDESNERLESLGDRILKGPISYYLYLRYHDREKFYSDLNIKLEKSDTLYRFGIALGFKKFLLLSKFIEDQTVLNYDRGRNTVSYYEDAFEAFIGAIMEDFGEKGYIYAHRFVVSVLENNMDFAEFINNNDNYKYTLSSLIRNFKIPCKVSYITFDESINMCQKVYPTVAILPKDKLDKVIDSSLLKVFTDYTEKTIKLLNDSSCEISTKVDLLNDCIIIGYGTGRKIKQSEQSASRIACKFLT